MSGNQLNRRQAILGTIATGVLGPAALPGTAAWRAEIMRNGHREEPLRICFDEAGHVTGFVDDAVWYAPRTRSVTLATP